MLTGAVKVAGGQRNFENRWQGLYVCRQHVFGCVSCLVVCVFYEFVRNLNVYLGDYAWKNNLLLWKILDAYLWLFILLFNAYWFKILLANWFITSILFYLQAIHKNTIQVHVHKHLNNRLIKHPEGAKRSNCNRIYEFTF